MANVKRCLICNEMMLVRPCLMERKKYCSKICQHIAMRGRHNSPATEFKPGQPSQSYLPIGTERESKGYVRVKVADPDIWRQRSHVVWEEANKRPLPAGWIVRHLDGNALNDTPENLRAISRGQHLLETLEIPEVQERFQFRRNRASKRRWKNYRAEKLEEELKQYDTYYWEAI